MISVMRTAAGATMDDRKGQQLYRVLDRVFWLIWLGYPALIWLLVTQIRSGAARLAEMAPEQAACLAMLPQVDTFSTQGKAVFWSLFALEFAIYAVLLALAHRVIHRCAVGRVLVTEMIGTLRAIGILIAGWPLVDLALSNLASLLLSRLGDMPGFVPSFALDLPVLGVGLLLLTIAAAMRQAVALREDAELTI